MQYKKKENIESCWDPDKFRVWGTHTLPNFEKVRNYNNSCQ